MVRLTQKTLIFVLKQVISILQYTLPHLITFVVFCLWLSVRLSVLAVISSVRGMDPIAQRLSEIWTMRAIESGFPYIWEIPLRRFFYALAEVTILTGWVIIFFTIVFTLVVTYELIF